MRCPCSQRQSAESATPRSRAIAERDSPARERISTARPVASQSLSSRIWDELSLVRMPSRYCTCHVACHHQACQARCTLVKRLLTVFAIAYTVARAVPYGHGLPLLSPWHVQYRTGMAFSLVVAHPAEGSTMLITRPGTAAPDSAIATAQLDSVGLTVR